MNDHEIERLFLLMKIVPFVSMVCLPHIDSGVSVNILGYHKVNKVVEHISTLVATI